MPYFNPGGHNLGPANHDGWGITLIIFSVVYSVCFYAACLLLWCWRKHPVVRMRKIGLTLMSVLILHVYILLVLLIYPINGSIPCRVEFWVMSIYLPVGIGLFQAQNQQLLIVSREQQIAINKEVFKPLPPGRPGPKQWWIRLQIWCTEARKQQAFEGLVAIGIIVQFLVSLFIFLVNRQFNPDGLFGHQTTPALCRRGWGWVPSIIWQSVWIYIAGPYLLWKIRMIRDIYHWRLQTTLAIVAGLPGIPLWLAATYSDKMNKVNKYWVPPMWLVLGLIIMEFITVTNPLAQIFRYNKSKKKTLRFSEPVDARHPARDRPTNTYHTIKSLEECLETNPKALQEYAAKKDFSIENINFLIKVPKFRQEWELTFNSRNTTPERSRRRMFQEAVEIYTTFVNPETAKLQINISGSIHAQLKKLFGEATKAIAVRRPNTHHQPTSEVTPWETAPDTQPKAASQFKGLFDKAMKKVFDGPNTWFRRNSEHIRLIERLHNNPLANIHIPVEFDKHCFDAAESSIKGLVYTSTWQEFNKRNSNPAV